MTRRLPAILLGATLASLGACSAATPPEETLDPGSHRASGQLAITASGRESGESIRWEKGAVTHGGKVTSFTVKPSRSTWENDTPRLTLSLTIVGVCVIE